MSSPLGSQTCPPAALKQGQLRRGPSLAGVCSAPAAEPKPLFHSGPSRPRKTEEKERDSTGHAALSGSGTSCPRVHLVPLLFCPSLVSRRPQPELHRGTSWETLVVNPLSCPREGSRRGMCSQGAGHSPDHCHLQRACGGDSGGVMRVPPTQDPPDHTYPGYSALPLSGHRDDLCRRGNLFREDEWSPRATR